MYQRRYSDAARLKLSASYTELQASLQFQLTYAHNTLVYLLASAACRRLHVGTVRNKNKARRTALRHHVA